MEHWHKTLMSISHETITNFILSFRERNLIRRNKFNLGFWMISSIVTSVVKDSFIFWGPFKLYKRVSFLNVLVFRGENAFLLYCFDTYNVRVVINYFLIFLLQCSSHSYSKTFSSCSYGIFKISKSHSSGRRCEIDFDVKRRI